MIVLFSLYHFDVFYIVLVHYVLILHIYRFSEYFVIHRRM